MEFELIIKEEAKEEISDAYHWYETKQEKLGERFLNALDECFFNISKYPKQFAKKYKELRQALVSKFPYVVIFEIEKKVCVIYAVFHTSRDSKVWKNR